MPRRSLWLLVSVSDARDLPWLVPTVAWMADAADASFETYFESPRDGSLFAEHGSTVLGGHHHQQFNYLCARFDVTLVRYGLTTVLDSSATVFGLPTISASSPAALYRALLRRHPEVRPEGILIGPSRRHPRRRT